MLPDPSPPRARPSAPSPRRALRWDARAVEHLWNRAGLGPAPGDVERGLALGAEALVDELLAVPEGGPEVFRGAERILTSAERERLRALPEDERRQEARLLRRQDREELRSFLGWWLERLLRAERPLQERMTLFWHGHFTSSYQDVQRARQMVEQDALLRRHALGSFRELLHGIARDPAMLTYLDNDSNREGNPNENFARELLELFTLGEGNYSEQDVKEVARAFTGWSARGGEFRFEQRRHDRGVKRVLGVRGRLDGDDVLEILLERGDCARHVARRILRYLEGLEPEPGRLASYARLLRCEDWRLAPFLRRLFLDPAFHRDEALGARVASPIDFLVGVARRAGVRPPPELLTAGCALLGETPCFPPSVAGWPAGPEGTRWITAGTLLLRANLAGCLLGEVRPRELFERGADDPALGGPAGLGRGLARLAWRPRLALARELRAAGAASDEEAADLLLERFLAVPAGAATRAAVRAFLAAERARRGAPPGPLLARSTSAEPILRRTAHFVLGLPEAQLL